MIPRDLASRGLEGWNCHLLDWIRYRFYPWKTDVGQIKSSILNVLSLRCLFNIQRRASFVSLEFWSRLECSS